jgi:hypothetical protein
MAVRHGQRLGRPPLHHPDRVDFLGVGQHVLASGHQPREQRRRFITRPPRIGQHTAERRIAQFTDHLIVIHP